MRGEDRQSGALSSYVSCEERVPQDHSLRRIRAIVDEALEMLSSRGCTRKRDGLRSRPRSCCGHCCSRRFTRFARSGMSAAPLGTGILKTGRTLGIGTARTA
jgi:hypothetical protein